MPNYLQYVCGGRVIIALVLQIFAIIVVKSLNEDYFLFIEGYACTQWKYLVS